LLLNPSECRVTDLTAPPSQALSGRRELVDRAEWVEFGRAAEAGARAKL